MRSKCDHTEDICKFEPMLDYCVVKLPRLPFDKFISAKRTLTTQMKATGEVMSICDNFEGALMKAIRSLEQHVDSLMSYDFTDLSVEELTEQLEIVDDMRMWRIAEAIRRGVSYEKFTRSHRSMSGSLINLQSLWRWKCTEIRRADTGVVKRSKTDGVPG